jgi:hypothetical protein
MTRDTKKFTRSRLVIYLQLLSVLTAVDPAYLRLLVEGVVTFTNRNAGRRVQLKVGDTELTIDRPTRGEVETVIQSVQSAVERDLT